MNEPPYFGSREFIEDMKRAGQQLSQYGEHRHECSGKHVAKVNGHYEICACGAARLLTSGDPSHNWQEEGAP